MANDEVKKRCEELVDGAKKIMCELVSSGRIG